MATTESTDSAGNAPKVMSMMKSLNGALAVIHVLLIRYWLMEYAYANLDSL